jgi:two-component system, OmpR family, manganese sensing response regulator
MATVLLVEDDRVLSETMRAYLEFKHHVVDRAFDGLEARDKITHGEYDLILLDWQLPDAEGVDICREYRCAGGSTPVLLLTGRQGSEARCAGKEAGATSSLTKPFKLQELATIVEKLIGAEANN